ncbi:uncharacterized protein LOC135935062 [Cloeon dipterum]|uniref:uncharacterized protein LOC135935062 n=1 Tax=Cloeon dipterum TaxID=197152 RepID=UPI00321F65DA
MIARQGILLLHGVSLLFCTSRSDARFVEGEILTSNDLGEYGEATVDLQKSANQIINEIQSIFSKQEDCLIYGAQCTLDSSANGYKPCCESLACLRTENEQQYFCLCERGLALNHEGVCFWPVYPNFMTVVVWLIVGLALTVSCSYLLVACFRKKQNRTFMGDLSYSTFESHVPDGSMHMTSVLSPVATSQTIDLPVMYQMEDMPPSYEDAYVIKQHKS